MEERRRHPRFGTLNLIYYVVRDGGSCLAQDMGRTLDASKRGLLIETRIPLAEGLQIQMDIGLADSILSLAGVVIHSRITETGMYLSGVEFTSVEADKHQQLMEYLRQFDPKKTQKH